jgi:outer membrane protein TolC
MQDESLPCRAIVLAFAALVASCAAGPDFKRPTAPPATQYTTEALGGKDAAANATIQHIALGSLTQGDWWALFHSSAIDQLVQQAAEHNRNLAAARATHDQAREFALATGGAGIRRSA